MNRPPDGWSPLPRDVRPMLATAGPLPRDDDRWAYEVKWDGVRALVAVDGGRVTLTSRNGNDVTSAYPELGSLGRELGGTQALLDAEVVALGPDGRSDFALLQSRMHVRGPSTGLLRSTPVQLMVFDLLHLDGTSLLDRSYDERREALATLDLVGDHWQVPEAFLGNGQAVFDATKAQGLEGLVAKRRDARYVPGRRSDWWLKVKHIKRTSAVVVGWKPGEGGRSGQIGSLLLAVTGPAGLEFAGHVGTGFTQATLTMLKNRLEPLRRDTSPLAEPIPSPYGKDAVFVQPELVVEVDYTEWTKEGRLRHPSYKGLREDYAPEDVVRQ